LRTVFYPSPPVRLLSGDRLFLNGFYFNPGHRHPVMDRVGLDGLHSSASVCLNAHGAWPFGSCEGRSGHHYWPYARRAAHPTGF